jgi:hypothetical protein
LSAIAAFRGTPDDVEEAVAARVSRNRMLRSGNHRFTLLREESVLRYRLGAPEVMAAQLGYLLEATELPSMSLGVIPFAGCGRTVRPLESFTVFDDERVHIELLSAQVTVTAPSEITLYVRAFEKLAELAVYGTQTRALITSAIDALGGDRHARGGRADPGDPPEYPYVTWYDPDRGGDITRGFAAFWTHSTTVSFERKADRGTLLTVGGHEPPNGARGSGDGRRSHEGG